jgi:hypothetical protein
MGIYRDAVAQFQKGLDLAPDITNHPWHITRKYGFGVNLEQNLTCGCGIVDRTAWAWPSSPTRSPRITRPTWPMEDTASS